MPTISSSTRTLGVILGGRLGYVLFYKPVEYFHNPVEIVRLWDGGMSFHGGVIGVSLGIFYMAWRQKLDWLRIHDYVACCVPFGLFLGRLANFVNGELWGAPTTLPWGIVFPYAGEVARHPSQLYEAALEGIFLFLVLWFMFWKTQARYQPGKLVGAFILVYGLCRFGARIRPRAGPASRRLRAGDPSAYGPVAVAADDRPRPLLRPYREQARRPRPPRPGR